MSAKAEDRPRQQYLVSRKNLNKLGEMSHRGGVFAGELARRSSLSVLSEVIL